MSFNFDKIISRKNTNSFKWDKYDDSVLPMWVADMDFESPVEIKAALQKLTDSGVYGYAKSPDKLNDIIVKRLKERHDWDIKADWIVLLPGLVPGLHASARIFESTEDFSIMTSTPVYYHLSLASKSIEKKTIEVPFVWTNNQWEMDFEAMQENLELGTKIYMLCNPHNPNGRVFSKEELHKLVDFCLKNNLVLVSDEIHCDLILDKNKKHISAASLNSEIENQSISLLAPSKTFNIAGLGGSFAVIPNAEIREKFTKACFGIMPHMSAFAFETMIAAYEYGENWRQELIKYLKGNHDYLLSEVNKIPGISMESLEATYLAWIKVERDDIPNPEEYLLKYGLGVSGGYQFKGNGYFRLNFGTQRANVEQAVEILKVAFR